MVIGLATRPFVAPSSFIRPSSSGPMHKRYARRYGLWWPIIGQVARRLLRCGYPQFGLARVGGPHCRHEMFVPFFCRQRCLCPNWHQKRTLLAAKMTAHTICAPVPHRQLVFTIPKRVGIYCRYDRTLLGYLFLAASVFTRAMLPAGTAEPSHDEIPTDSQD